MGEMKLLCNFRQSSDRTLQSAKHSLCCKQFSRRLNGTKRKSVAPSNWETITKKMFVTPSKKKKKNFKRTVRLQYLCVYVLMWNKSFDTLREFVKLCLGIRPGGTLPQGNANLNYYTLNLCYPNSHFSHRTSILWLCYSQNLWLPQEFNHCKKVSVEGEMELVLTTPRIL